MEGNGGRQPGRTAVLGSLGRELPIEAERADTAAALERRYGYGLFILAPADGDEALALLKGLQGLSGHADVLRVTAPSSDIRVPGVSLRSDWLLEELAAMAAEGVALLAPNRPWSALMVRAMEGELLPLFVHNVNNLMVGAMGNLDLAALFSGDSEKCGAKLEEASAALQRLNEFIVKLGIVSRALPERGLPARWKDLEIVSTMAGLASGRSVRLEADSKGLQLESQVCTRGGLEARTFRLLCGALAAAALKALGGCGRLAIAADADLPSVRVAWSGDDPESQAMHDREGVTLSLAAAMAALPSSGGSLSIKSPTPNSGEALLLPLCSSS